MSIIPEPERTKLYTKLRHLLGAPLRSIELEDEQLDSLLELAIEDYSQYIQDWLIESQWSSLYGLNLDTQSLSKAFITKGFDFEDRYSYAYSKIVGLQTGGDYVLKKDYIQLVPNQQIYEIPAGREVNELLWFTPAELNNFLFDPWTFGGLGGIGLGGSINAGGDIIAYSSSDIRLKNNIRPISNPLEKISKIGGYNFEWNSEMQDTYIGNDIGVIAQEIETILPELVQTRENGYKAVKYDKLVALLIEGIKELTKQVEYLKTKIEN